VKLLTIIRIKVRVVTNDVTAGLAYVVINGPKFSKAVCRTNLQLSLSNRPAASVISPRLRASSQHTDNGVIMSAHVFRMVPTRSLHISK